MKGRRIRVPPQAKVIILKEFELNRVPHIQALVTIVPKNKSGCKEVWRPMEGINKSQPKLQHVGPSSIEGSFVQQGKEAKQTIMVLVLCPINLLSLNYNPNCMKLKAIWRRHKE